MIRADRGAAGAAGLAALALAACAGPEAGSEGRAVLSPPADAAFVPFLCGGGAATDPAGDTPAGGHRDVVGTSALPAILRASDDTHLYLRMRLDGDPRQAAGDLRPHGWGFLFDDGGGRQSYELLVLARGTGSDSVTLQENTAEQPELASDPSEATLAVYEPPADFWHAAPAPGSSINGDPDYFLTIAVPWADLAAAGADRAETRVMWAGTTGAADALDADLACHDGGDGDPALSAIATDPAPLAAPPAPPDLDGDGLSNEVEHELGTDPGDPDSDGDGIDDPTETDGGSPVDSDGDGTIDALDLDADGDGAPDADEGTGDGDGDG
ncbi:MAG TPA: hypothetical protein VKZ63_09735, partial [Kofleriaceae bacterium]|nr:hypothetical protein [Kofleriaceae bacterium]